MSKGKVKKNHYFFIGVIHPERAVLHDRSLNVTFGVSDNPSKWECKARILCNQLVAHVTTDVEVNEFFLRIMVQSVINDELARLAFILGYDFKLSLDRAINQSIGLDRVFGIDNPYVGEVMKEVKFDDVNIKLQSMSKGVPGTYVRRAMNDLKSALSSREDAAFYCFRALESLRNHYNVYNNIKPSREAEWVAFREFVNVSKSEIVNEIKVHSDAIRHGHPTFLDEESYKLVMTKTWTLVMRYISNFLPD